MTKLVKSEEGLEAHAVALRAGLDRGLNVEGLRKMLIDEHGVTVSSRWLLSSWMGQEMRRRDCTGQTEASTRCVYVRTQEDLAPLFS